MNKGLVNGKILVRVVLIAALVAFAFALQVRGRLGDDWDERIVIEPVDQLEPVTRFFVDNPHRGRLWVSHNLPVRFEPGPDPRGLKRVTLRGRVMPPGFLDLFFDLENGTELHIRMATAPPFSNGIVTIADSQGEQTATFDLPFSALGNTFFPLDDPGKLPAPMFVAIAPTVPAILPRLDLAASLSEGILSLETADRIVYRGRLPSPVTGVGIMALGSDYPAYIEQMTFAFAGDEGDTIFTFAPESGRLEAFVTAWVVSAIGLALLIMGLRLVVLRRKIVPRNEERIAGSFWPLALTPLFSFTALPLLFLLSILVMVWRMRRRLDARLRRLHPPSRIPLAVLPLLLLAGQSILWSIEPDAKVSALVLTFAAWVLPYAVSRLVAKVPASVASPFLLAACIIGIIIQIALFGITPKTAFEQAAVAIFAVQLFAAGLSVFLYGDARWPNFALFLLALLFFAGAEAALQQLLATERTLPDIYERDGRLFWKLKNMPSPDLDPMDPEGRLAICLGGSVTYGAGLLSTNNAYPAVLERMLNTRDPDHRWHVINGGVSGYCALQGKLLLEQWLPLHPDVVTAAFGVNEYNESGFALTLVEWWNRRQTQTAVQVSPLQKSAVYRLLRAFLSFRDSGLSRLPVGNMVLAPNSTPAEFESILTDIATSTANLNGRTVLIEECNLKQLFGPSPVDPYNQGTAHVAQQIGAPLVSLPQMLTHHKNDRMLLDSVHPTVHFHQMIAEKLTDSILE